MMFPGKERITVCTNDIYMEEEQRQEAKRKKIDVREFEEFVCSRWRKTLFRLGEQVPTSYIASMKESYFFKHTSKLNHAISYLEVGRWFKENGYNLRRSPHFTDRRDLYAALAKKIEDQLVLYLEFGVWQGASLRIWSNLLRNPLSSLHGFDSFEGLPEAWNTFNKGTFDIKGVLPQFDDPRIILHKGWFQETLPGFVLPKHERLLLNLDADLYSSTKYVLDTLGEAICPGTILLFDEFHDRLHEVKAFSEFLKTTGMKFRLLGTAWYYGLHSAFERIE